MLATYQPSTLADSAHTVDLKYITSTQVLEVAYESFRRRFAVVSVSALRSTKTESIDDLARGLDYLSVSPSTKLWVVGWDSTVVIVGEEAGIPTTTTAHKVIPISSQLPSLHMAYLI